MTTARERHPEIFVEHHEDPRQRRRKVPMEVLSLGFSRTGTMTMKAALEILGCPTWHWVTMSENPPDMDMWLDAFKSKYEPNPDTKPFSRAEYDNLLGNWSATTDQPASYLSEDIIAAYPEAKVVLAERDEERWYKSFGEVVINGTANPFIPLICLIDRTYIGRMAALTDIQVKHYFGVKESRTKYGVLNNPKFFDEWHEKARDTYRKHNERIKRLTPKDRLLLFKLEDGWVPLCKFLNKPVPDVPFPRVNETAVAQEMVNLYIFEGYKRSARNFVRTAGPVLMVMIATLILWKGGGLGKYNPF